MWQTKWTTHFHKKISRSLFRETAASANNCLLMRSCSCAISASHLRILQSCENWFEHTTRYLLHLPNTITKIYRLIMAQYCDLLVSRVYQPFISPIIDLLTNEKWLWNPHHKKVGGILPSPQAPSARPSTPQHIPLHTPPLHRSAHQPAGEAQLGVVAELLVQRAEPVGREDLDRVALAQHWCHRHVQLVQQVPHFLVLRQQTNCNGQHSHQPYMSLTRGYYHEQQQTTPKRNKRAPTAQLHVNMCTATWSQTYAR